MIGSCTPCNTTPAWVRVLTWTGALIALFWLFALLETFGPKDPRELAIDAACVEAAMRFPNPDLASWPRIDEARAVPIGRDRWDVCSSVAGPGGFGRKALYLFRARVVVPEGVRNARECRIESLQFVP